MECSVAIDRSVHCNTARLHGVALEWYWSGIGLCRKYINWDSKDTRIGIGVYCKIGTGVVVMGWQWSMHSRVALECQWSVPLMWHRSASQICKLTLPLQGFYSLSGKTSYRKISWSLGAARLRVIMMVSLWNLTGILAAQSGNGVAGMEWQWCVHFIATPAKFWKC